MSNIYLFITTVLGICSLVSSTITFGVKFFKANKARKAAESEAERQKAENDMLATAEAYVERAEADFADLNAVMKAQGSSAGAIKKDSVFTKLQNHALQHGYTFDAAFWLAKIDEIVAFTRKVNAKESTENTENADKTT